VNDHKGLHWSPSIYILYLLNPIQGHKPIPAATGQMWGTPWIGFQSTTGPHRDKQPCMLTFTPRVNLKSPIKLTCMLLDYGRKPEYLERTLTYTGRTCKLHTERPQPRFEPGTLLLWGDSANQNTTVQPSIDLICRKINYVLRHSRNAAISSTASCFALRHNRPAGKSSILTNWEGAYCQLSQWSETYFKV